jgi:hypothetical protein
MPSRPSVGPLADDPLAVPASSRTLVHAVPEERIGVDVEGRVIEYYYSVFRPDRYAFCVKMHRKQG